MCMFLPRKCIYMSAAVSALLSQPHFPAQHLLVAMAFLSALQRLLGYADDEEEAPEAQSSTPTVETGAVLQGEETPTVETAEAEPPLPEEPETPYWEEDRQLECPVPPPWRMPQPPVGPPRSSPAADVGPAPEPQAGHWQPPPEFDLRWCDLCQSYSYLRKKACVNSTCASHLQLVLVNIVVLLFWFL